jgi:iron complex transport system substrate-binding protein
LLLFVHKKKILPFRYLMAMLLLSGPAHAFNRVVSLNLCTDDLLVALAPAKIAALSPLSRDPALALRVGSYPIVPPNAEAVLDLHPDLILAAAYGATTTVAILEARGLPVWRTSLPQDLTGIAAETLQLGALLGVPGRARALVEQMDRTLAAIPRHDRGTALIFEARGYVDQPGTLGDAVLRAAGYRNQAARPRIDLESLVTNPPDLLVTARRPSFPSLATDLLDHPVLARLRRRAIDPTLLICAGPWTAQAAASLAAP